MSQEQSAQWEHGGAGEVGERFTKLRFHPEVLGIPARLRAKVRCASSQLRGPILKEGEVGAGGKLGLPQ